MNIAQQLQTLHEERKQLQKAFAKHSVVKQFNLKFNEINEKIRQVKDSCPHTDIEHHPDASGNNDSWYSCRMCGRESSRKSKWVDRL